MKDIKQETMLTAIGNVMRRCYERGWITTRDGNISGRMILTGPVAMTLWSELRDDPTARRN